MMNQKTKVRMLMYLIKRIFNDSNHLKNKTFFFAIPTILLSFFIFIPELSPILDGRVAPIYLDDRYTFTNNEWARGLIFFNQGFDLPTNGTVHLSLDGGAVTGSIALNGGTLLIEKSLRLQNKGFFSAPGYLRAKSLSNYVFIYHESIQQNLFVGTGKIKLYGPFIIQGLSTNAKFDQTAECILDLSESPSDLNIVGGTVWWRNIITSSSMPPKIYLYNVTTLLLNNTIISTPTLYFGGISSITTNGLAMLQSLALIGSGKLIMYPKSDLQLKYLDIPNQGTRLELKNTTLDFINSGTGQINICTPYSSQGAISIEGECVFKSSTNNQLWLDERVDLEIFSGSRLLLNPATSLSIVPFI